jgi:predicted transposase YbfD/YdcC
MSQRPDVTIVTHFSGLEDPRVDRRKLHPLINVVVIALSAIICGAEGWTDVELFGQAKGKWVAEFLDKPEQWPAFQTIVMVRAERRVGDQVEVETGYFISSLPSDAQQVLAAVRQHWHIENRVHWVLDVTFREDESRIRIGHAAQNMAVLRHMALNLIKREQTSRRSIRGKRLKAGWDEDYLTRVLCANEDAIALRFGRKRLTGPCTCVIVTHPGPGTRWPSGNGKYL